MKVNVSNVCWVYTAVESWLQGKKQEVSCWCKQGKFIYEDNVREIKLYFMKIGENLSDFTLWKLITIFVKIFAWSIPDIQNLRN